MDVNLPSQVQLALLTAVVKLFIYKSQSDTSKEIVHKVLKWATEDVDNPDLRDRGFMYWRLLAINPANAGEIVLADKPSNNNRFGPHGQGIAGSTFTTYWNARQHLSQKP